MCRTATKWKDLNPYFGEEFHISMSSSFKNVSLYVYDDNRLLNEEVIGKLSFSNTQLLTDTELRML